MNHLAFECAALVILGGIEFEETEHGVQAVDVQAGGSIKDTRDNLVSIFSPCHQHLLRTKVFYVQVQSTLFIHFRTLRFVVDEHHIRRGSLSVDVVKDILVPRSLEAGVVNTASVHGPLILYGHDELDLTPHIVEAALVREGAKVSDEVDLLPIIPVPFQVDVLGVKVLHATAENQQPLHLWDLRNAGDLKKRWFYWKYVCVVGGEYMRRK